MSNTSQITFTPSEHADASIIDSSSSLNYFVRYRSVSENQDILSDWTNIKTIQQNSISTILNGFTPTYTVSSVESGGSRLNIRWTIPQSLSQSKFDIYLSWSYDNGGTYSNYQYADTVSSSIYYY